jgi:serine/threonine protein kinase
MGPSPGQVIGGKYRIVRLIGDGGMGAVFEARHEVLGSTVALKFLHPELVRRTGLAARFLQEARVSASIQSPHVTRVIDVDQTPDGAPYLVMELLIGESLQQMLDRHLKLPRDQVIDYALQILSGLEAAHALGVVHRDLKPDNVFVTTSGGGPVLKLLDFGIAKLRQAHEFQKGLTRPGMVMGTPEYMAPEQLYAAEQVDHRADLYSLGAMLYEALAGVRPADGDDATQIIAQVTLGRVQPLLEREPSLPAGLAAAIHRALDPEPDRRFQNATEMRVELAQFAGHLSYAGRLAATPAPGAVSPPVAAASAVAPTPPYESAPGVPPTLPPDDEPAAAAPLPGGKGSTQDASREEIQRNIATSAQQSAPLAPPAALAAPVPAVLPPSPLGPRRRRGSVLRWVMALFLGLTLLGLTIVVVVAVQQDQDRPPPLPTFAAATTEGSGAALEDGGADWPLGDTTSPTPPTPPDWTSPPAGPADAGAGRSTSADTGTGSFSLPPLPSALPPLPSALPPLPSALPPLPSALPSLPSALPPLPSALPPLPSALPPLPPLTFPGPT